MTWIMPSAGPASTFNMDPFTDFILHFALPQADGTVTLMDGPTSATWAQAWVARAHQLGKKVHLGVAGSGGNQWHGRAMLDAMLADVDNLAANIITLAGQLGVDGISIDYEPIGQEAIPLLVDLFAPLAATSYETSICFGGYNLAWTGEWYPGQEQLYHVADLNLSMSYDLAGDWSGWATWHNSPLFGEKSNTPMSANFNVRWMVEHGCDPATIVLGLGAYGFAAYGPKKPGDPINPGDQRSTPADLTYDILVSSYLPQMHLEWDQVARTAYAWSDTAVGPAGITYVSFDTQPAVAEKLAYVNTSQLAGTAVWNGAYSPTFNGWIGAARTSSRTITMPAPAKPAWSDHGDGTGIITLPYHAGSTWLVDGVRQPWNTRQITVDKAVTVTAMPRPGVTLTGVASWPFTPTTTATVMRNYVRDPRAANKPLNRWQAWNPNTNITGTNLGYVTGRAAPNGTTTAFAGVATAQNDHAISYIEDDSSVIAALPAGSTQNIGLDVWVNSPQQVTVTVEFVDASGARIGSRPTLSVRYVEGGAWTTIIGQATIPSGVRKVIVTAWIWTAPAGTRLECTNARICDVPELIVGDMADTTVYDYRYAGYVSERAAIASAASAGVSLSNLWKAPQNLDSQLAAHPELAPLNKAQFKWLASPTDDTQARVQGYVSAAAGKTMMLTVYTIPGRDNGGYSAGGFPSASAYLTWCQQMVAGIGTAPAIVCFEPDALGFASTMSGQTRTDRLALIRDALALFAAVPTMEVYCDLSMWATDPAGVFQQVHSAGVKGFTINVANFETQSSCYTFGDQVVAQLAAAGIPGMKYIVDSSRNGNGPLTSGSPDAAPWVNAGMTWCNPPHRRYGLAPGTTDSAHPACRANLWIKNPGDSDGTFPTAAQSGYFAGQSAPAAGDFWVPLARDLSGLTH